nr:PREDICTED: cadherin-related family member 5 isoform X2 [Latimeria chalumnae]|eukprot:XP_014343492.1 PREDICTED: cadherin-related family member 5 isoform X2 [Latimeria chalumnae]
MVLQVEALDKVNGQSATAQISVESKSGTVSTTTGTAVTQPVTGPGVTITKPPSTGTTTAAPTKSIVPNTGSTTTRSPALSSTTLPALGSGHTEKPGATSSTVTIATTRVTSPGISAKPTTAKPPGSLTTTASLPGGTTKPSNTGSATSQSASFPGPSTTTKSPGSALPETGTTSWRTTGSPSTNRPSTKPSQPPGLVTTPGQAGPSSSSLPVTLTNSVILPGPNLIHTAQDMAALGATLAVLLVISLILNGLFAYKIYKKRVKKYNSIYQDNVLQRGGSAVFNSGIRPNTGSQLAHLWQGLQSEPQGHELRTAIQGTITHSSELEILITTIKISLAPLSKFVEGSCAGPSQQDLRGGEGPEPPWNLGPGLQAPRPKSRQLQLQKRTRQTQRKRKMPPSSQRVPPRNSQRFPKPPPSTTRSLPAMVPPNPPAWPLKAETRRLHRQDLTARTSRGLRRHQSACSKA